MRARQRAAAARLFAAFLTLVLVSPATAQDHPNFERGLGASTTYQSSESESVNLFNGNLHLSIPLGWSYPLGGGLSYGFALHYNSNVWELEDGSPAGSIAAVPDGFSNAGFGWILTMGQIFPPLTPPNDSNSWLLLEPDGSRREFFDRLHPDDALVSNLRYTRDGSYLRMKDLAGGEKQVESPDGTLRIFRADGKLRRISDPFGNYLDISHPFDLSKWVITDQHGRTQTVNLSTVQDATKGHVTSLVLDGFGTATSTYTLVLTPTSIQRHYKNTASNSANVTVPLLTRVDLAEDATGANALGAWVFLYNTTNVLVDGHQQPSGTLKRTTLPTLGRHDYVYAPYGFPVPPGPCGEPKCFPTWTTSGDGLRSKKRYDAAGAAAGTWSYVQVDTGLDTTRTETRVTSPAGDETRHFFRLNTYNWQHGLPYDPNVKDATNTRYLSQEIYQSTVSGGTRKRSVYLRFATDKPQSLKTNQRVESRRVLYHDDTGISPTGTYADVTHSKFDGLGHYRQTDTGGNFESANVRTQVTRYNVFTGGYTYNSGTYDYDWTTGAYKAGHAFTMVPAGSRWLVDAYSEASVKEGTQEIKTQVCLETTAAGPTGFVKRVRRLKGATAGVNDVLAVLTPDADGNVLRQQLYGGDLQSLGTQADPCTATLPAGDAYRVDQTWQKGALATAEAKTSGGAGIGVKTVHRVIDGSGLVSSADDVADLTTTYEYDRLGRVTWEKPEAGQGAWTEYVYTKATGAAALATVTVNTRNGSKTGTVLTEDKVKLDAFGRLWREEHRMPSGTWSSREHLYDTSGRLASASAWGDFTEKTTYTDYDPFGRPGTVTPPDGSAHKVTFSYKGDRQIDRQTRVATSTSGSEGLIFSGHKLDRQGRLYQATEASAGPTNYVTTTYAYDAAGRLKSASTPVSGLATQTRNFTYDNRGFLLSAKSPEKGASGNGTVTWSSFDALGNPGRVLDAPADLGLTWDRAGRVTEVRNRLTAEVLESYAYATANGIGDYRKGKLQTANRYNHLAVGTSPIMVQIQETYVYGGVGGRISSRDTFWANSTTLNRFTQGWAYDQLGNVTTLTYPRCTHGGCTGVAATSRIASFTHTRGALTTAASTSSPTMGSNTLTYHPNGTVATVAHGNGVTWTQGLDADNLPRPASIQAAVGANPPLWASGTYAYDGTGNVKAIGGSKFTYDAVSRLVDAQLVITETGTTPTKSQSFTYDAFGNLKSTAGSSGLTIPVSATTNRLTTSGAGPDCTATETYYDAAGNLTCWQGNAFVYDPMGRVMRTLLSGNEYDHAYTPGGERIFTYQPGVGYRWTLRDLDGKVLREFKNTASTWTVERDYLYRDGVPLAAKQPSGEVYHLHPDHLGTPRLVTGNGGAKRAFHAYYPYGEEATGINQDGERLKFTGHERDLGLTTSAADDVDYMHARWTIARIGRFTQTDPIEGNPWAPQTWNRYAYVNGNPLTFVDRYGLDEEGGAKETFGETITVTATPHYWDTHFPSGWLGFLSGWHSGSGGQGGGGASKAASPPANPPVWTNPTNGCPRGQDKHGMGHYGAPRGPRSAPHKGTDFKATPGQTVTAPYEGSVTRKLSVYPNESYRGLIFTTTNGYTIKMLYTQPDPSLGSAALASGDVIGSAQSLQPKYPGITDHVHVQITDSTGKLVDPLTLIPLPPGCPP